MSAHRWRRKHRLDFREGRWREQLRHFLPLPRDRGLTFEYRKKSRVGDDENDKEEVNNNGDEYRLSPPRGIALFFEQNYEV